MDVAARPARCGVHGEGHRISGASRRDHPRSAWALLHSGRRRGRAASGAHRRRAHLRIELRGEASGFSMMAACTFNSTGAVATARPRRANRRFVRPSRCPALAPHRCPGSGHVSHCRPRSPSCAARCLERRPLVASIDSALRQGAITRVIWRRLSARSAAASLSGVPALVDRRAESGLESPSSDVLLRDLGLHVSAAGAFPGSRPRGPCWSKAGWSWRPTAPNSTT